METTTTTATAEALENGNFELQFLTDGRVTEHLLVSDRALACSTLVQSGFVGHEATDLVDRASQVAGLGLLAFGVGTGVKA